MICGIGDVGFSIIVVNFVDMSIVKHLVNGVFSVEKSVDKKLDLSLVGRYCRVCSCISYTFSNN